MWQLQDGNIKLNIVLQDSDIETTDNILAVLEIQLNTEYPDRFPYGCYDVDIISMCEDIIDIIVYYEDHWSDNNKIKLELTMM